LGNTVLIIFDINELLLDGLSRRQLALRKAEDLCISYMIGDVRIGMRSP